MQSAESWGLAVGEPVRVVGDQFQGQANVLAMAERDGRKTLTLDQPLDAPAGADCASPLRCGSYYKILRSTIRGARSRGIIAKGDNGLIRGCTVGDCGLGILLGPGGSEAGYYHQATVVDNTIAGCRWAGISFESNGRIALRDTRVVGNRFVANASYDGHLLVSWVDGLPLSGNTSMGPTWWQNDPNPPITIGHARNVRVSGNQFTRTAAYEQPLVRVKGDVERLTEGVASAPR